MNIRQYLVTGLLIIFGAIAGRYLVIADETRAANMVQVYHYYAEYLYKGKPYQSNGIINADKKILTEKDLDSVRQNIANRFGMNDMNVTRDIHIVSLEYLGETTKNSEMNIITFTLR